MNPELVAVIIDRGGSLVINALKSNAVNKPSAEEVMSKFLADSDARMQPYIDGETVVDPESTSIPAVSNDYTIHEKKVEVENNLEYSGTSQISAAGKGCLPCSASHLSTVSGELTEAIRFARDGGIQHPEVMFRIADAEDQLNALERIDGAPTKVAKLPPDERALMNDVLKTSRNIRHVLTEVKSVDDLENLAAFVQDARKDYRTKLFQMQVAKLSPVMQAEVQKRVEAIREQGRI